MIPKQKPLPKRPKHALNLRALSGHFGLDKAMHKYQVAYLYYFNGWQAHEIAEELHVTQKSVENIIQRLKG